MTGPDPLLPRALAFLAQRAEPELVCRARAVTGEAVRDEALAQLEGHGHEREAGESTARLVVLAALDDLGALDTPLSRRLCSALAKQQLDDGSWGSVTAEPADRIELTGSIAGYLAKTPYVRERALDAAADFLASLWDPDRLRGDAWAATLSYSHTFALIRHAESDAILQWCGRELQRGLVTGIYDAVQFARLLSLCRAHGLPGAPLRRDELVAQIRAQQGHDGSFRRSGDASVQSVIEHTYEALTAFVRLTRTS
jgi:hypothetical protein